MEHDKIIFVMSAARSGSTWLHLMLGSHPEIATGQESQVFSEYLAPLDARWRRELRYNPSEKVRKHGIAPYLSEEEFLGLLRHFAVTVFAKSLAEKPGARYFLEKSPNSTPHMELILRCFPRARFIHLIRDGRDVATSMLMASKGWGHSWAPRRVGDAASAWRGAVESVRRAAGARYTEVRYEDLLTRGVEELERLLVFLGLECPRAEVERIYEQFRFDKLASGNYSRDVFKNPGVVAASGTEGRKEPPGFFRKGQAGDWVNHLRRRDLAEFNWVAGDLLVELGYATPDQARKPRFMPLSLVLRKTLRSLKRRVARGIGRGLASPAQAS